MEVISTNTCQNEKSVESYFHKHMPKSVIGIVEKIILMKLILEVTLGHMASMGEDLDGGGS